MSPRTVRRLVLLVFVAGIGGMILGSILDNNGVAITFGLITATAALGLILVTAVADPASLRKPGSDEPDDHQPGADAAGARIEEQVERLVASGAPEPEVRELVRRVVAYARTQSA